MLEDGNAPRTFIGLRVKELASRIKSGDLELYRAIQDNPWVEMNLNDYDNKMGDFEIEKYMKKASK
jgi:hypothetical protein